MGDYVAGPPSLLKDKMKRLLDQNMAPGETVLFCLLGRHDQALVALQDRVIIIKTGMMAGATFGSKATSFMYRDVTGIEVEAGWTRAFIQIVTSGFEQSRRAKTNARELSDRPNELPNCLPILKSDLSLFQPYLDHLRRMVSEAKLPAQPTTVAPSSSLTDQLKELAELKTAGVLTADEFEQAKRKLLN